MRSEKDPFTLMRMIEVNVLNTLSTLEMAENGGAKKYFCVSTDKAANPVNMMGASKRIMELFLAGSSRSMPISTARFANVAFSDGSLLHGFNQRIQKRQPIAAPRDVRRYFVTAKEAGELCLMSALLGEDRDIFFPKMSEELNLITFAEIAERFIRARGYTPMPCQSEDEARQAMENSPKEGKWPCYFFESDTTGEKDFEEFYTNAEEVDWDRYETIGVVKNEDSADRQTLDSFRNSIEALMNDGSWEKRDLLELFAPLVPTFSHQERGKYLDSRM